MNLVEKLQNRFGQISRSRGTAFRKFLDVVLSGMSSRGLLQSSICRKELTEAAREEFSTRSRLHRQAVLEFLRTAGEPVTSERRDGLTTALAKAAEVDTQNLVQAIGDALPPGIGSVTAGELASIVAQERAEATHMLDVLELELRAASSPLDQLIRPYPGALAHWSKATSFLQSRQPDYENVVKESIAATEAIIKLRAKDENATLGGALRSIRSSLDPALVKALEGSGDTVRVFREQDTVRRPRPASRRRTLISCTPPVQGSFADYWRADSRPSNCLPPHLGTLPVAHTRTGCPSAT